MSLEDWQIELRRQFGREQKFRLKQPRRRTPIFSEFEVTNPQTQQHLPRARSAAGSRATTPAPAPTSPPTRSAPASTSSSRSPGSSSKRGGSDGARRPASSPPYSEVFLQYGAAREVRFRPGSRVPRRAGPAGRRVLRRRRRAAARGVRRASRRSWPRPSELEHELRCRRRRAGVRRRGARRRAPAASASREAFPRGIRSAAFKDLLKVPLYDYQREGAPVRRPRRPLPDRRRDGPGQDHPGHRRRRDHGPATSASSAC